MLALIALLAQATEPGAQLVPEGATVTATTRSWLLPEPQLDRCLLDAEELTACRSALAGCSDASRQSLQEASDALRVAQTRQSEQAAQIAACGARVEGLTLQRDDARRSQRLASVVALVAAVVGGLAVGLAL